MKTEDLTTILFCCGSLAAGGYLGVLTNKFFASKTDNKLHIVFYSFAGITLLLCIIFLIGYWDSFFTPISPLAIFALIFTISFSIILIVCTRKHLVTKFIYTIKELDPIINNFTSQADKSEIKLFGGDLNFLGNSPAEIDGNIQYSHLRSLNFNKVCILCEEPNDNTKQIRYGKIYSEIRNVELRFYNPINADLKVRGRLIEMQGSPKLLIYLKHNIGKYQTIETDTANTSGALYKNIWELVWSLITIPDAAQKQRYIDLYHGK